MFPLVPDAASVCLSIKTTHWKADTFAGCGRCREGNDGQTKKSKPPSGRSAKALLNSAAGYEVCLLTCGVPYQFD
jgi:hypothetical protein